MAARCFLSLGVSHAEKAGGKAEPIKPQHLVNTCEKGAVHVPACVPFPIQSNCPRCAFAEMGRGRVNSSFYECLLEMQYGFHNHYIILTCETDISEMSGGEKKKQQYKHFHFPRAMSPD